MRSIVQKKTITGWLLGGVMALAGCGDDGGSGASGPGASSSSGGGAGQGGAGSGAGASSGGSGQGGAFTVGPCVPAEGATSGSTTWVDGDDTTTVTIDDAASCTRSYTLSTTATLRDGLPGNPRTVVELDGQPVIRTGHDVFDALYALAVEEARENSVDAIQNFAFNGGNPIPCPSGGCYETGRLWTYVWTRDTAYSVALGLAALDPTRARNSLELKTSLRRDDTGREIVQDTGTGGSWPVSTDRVVWALGAWQLLSFLGGTERTSFRDLAYEAMKNTAERDRLVVWDGRDGLYHGEQSFLDWREQTYPAFTATDTAQIAMSKALGTNVGHLRLLEITAALATEKGLGADAARYQGWANTLRDAIHDRLWLDDEGLLSTYQPGTLDGAAVRRYDLLGSALAILSGVVSDAEAAELVANYPHLPQGAPVVWPQQQGVPIYHNRSIWPFVTAYWLRAAARVENAAAIDHAVNSLVRGSAMNLSNMENFEAVTGAPWLDDGGASGPVVNSQRQLWSVAGYVSMVHDVVFGLETSQTGIRFAPRITAGMRAELFGGASSIALSNLRYRGKRVAVRVVLPADAGSGVLEVASVRHNGVDVGTGFVSDASLADDNLFEVTLGAGSGGAGAITLLDEADIADYRNVFGPRTPNVTSLSIVNDRVRVAFDRGGEAAADVTFAVYRDGVMLTEGLSGSASTYDDAGSADHADRTYCYTVETRFASGNASQHARPACYWGPGSERVDTIGAASFSAQGGTLVNEYGYQHYQGWGDAAHTLTVANYTPSISGRHLLQVLAGNGAGGYTTGITCGVKSVEVYDGATRVGGGQLVMPHLEAWSEWRDSTFVSVELDAGTSYTIVIGEDDASGNMSDFDHFSLYGGTGGTGGRFNRVNVAQLKVLAVGD